jgi:subtilisin family serine protease
LGGDEDIDDAYEKISSMGIVKKIYPVRLYKRPAFEVSTGISSAARSDIAQKRAAYVDTFAPHVMGGVDKLHAEGLTGAGISVAIVDTGVDYTLPDLGGGFGPGYKISYGYDLVGDAYTGDNTPVPDPDPFSSCEGHGTHVAGIVGANIDTVYNFSGVVPDATLGMYRVFGCFDSVGDDVLISAFNMAYEAGADVITSSIGGASGWTEDPWAVAVTRIVEAGVPCTIAAGNDGSEGAFYASNAGDAIGAIAVGSIDSITSPANLSLGVWESNDTTTSTNFTYNLGTPDDITLATYPLWALTLNTSVVDDGCSAFPTDTPDLSSYIVLIRRGTCTFVEKANNAAAYGAKYVFYYNNAAGTLSPSADGANITGVAMVTADQGAEWITALADGETVDVTISGDSEFVTTVNNITGGYMSTYSSWSPTWEMYIKPEVSAPGGNIFSTYPAIDGGFAVLSGTSMATPYIAGVVALMKQVNRDLDPATIRAILGTTSNPVNYNDGATTYDYLAPVIQQGGGLVDAYSAVHTTTIISDANLQFNDTTNFVSSTSFSIENTSNTSITYTLFNLLAATAYTMYEGYAYPSTFPVDLVSTGATLTFSPSSLTIAAGSTSNVTVDVTLPEGLDETRLPVYSGFVAISASDGTNFTLPYAGAAASLINQTVFDIDDGYPYLTSSDTTTGDPVAANTVFTIPLSNTTNATASLPEIYIVLALGTAYLDVDIIPAGGSNVTYPNATAATGLGSIFGYPQVYQPRAQEFTTSFNGTLASGAVVPAGNYTLLARALKVLGSAEDNEFQTIETVPFTIQYV